MSMKTIYDINKESIINLFSDIIFLRGEEYYEDGLVTSIEPIDASTLSAVVQGNHDYVVSISLDNDGYILCECSCPCDFNCKHSAATLLKWLSVKNRTDVKLIKTKSEKRESIKQILAKKNKKELINLIQIFLEKHPDLTSYVTINASELSIKIRHLFSQFWEGYNVKNLISQLETILESIRYNKTQWNARLFQEMTTCTKLMIANQEQVYDEGELFVFLKEWFYTLGDVFSEIESTSSKKEEFIETLLHWMKEDEDDLGYLVQQAFTGMCRTKEDIQLIQGKIRSSDLIDYSYQDIKTNFLLKAYDKLNMHDAYINTALESDFENRALDKLMSINKYEEALKLCEKSNKNTIELEMKHTVILKKLDRRKEWQQSLMRLIQKTGSTNYVSQLKKGSSKKEWEKYRKKLINYGKSKRMDEFLSRFYYHESDYKTAYDYAQNLSDESYLELLAEKLRKTHPYLSCNIFKKLCFDYVSKGSGWPYKKAGRILKTIKKIDNNGEFFKKTKQQLIDQHKKKHSLMQIIKKI